MIGWINPGELTADGVDVFQVDERVAPDGDPDRNLTHLRACLPARARLHPMPVTDPDLGSAAKRYQSELPETLDVVHLGMGPDGHTASLVPGDTVLDVTDRRVALTGGEYQGHPRMTLTYPSLASAGAIVFLVPGEEKRDAVAKLIAGDRSIPAAHVAREHATLITDRAAAPEWV